jgi:hypothetical protein
MSTIGLDWVATIYRAVHFWLNGGNPYLAGTWFANPPWILPVLAPFALLPPQLGAYAIDAVALSGMVALAVRLRRPWVAFLAVVSWPMVFLLLDANVDGFVLWGLALGGPAGFFLLSLKPQVASLVGLVWLWQAWQRERLRGIVKLAGPTLAVAIIFTLLYPQWLSAVRIIHSQPEARTANFFPWLVLPALVVLVWSIRWRHESGAAVATTWLSPYFQEHSYVGALMLIAADFPWLGALLVAIPWACWLAFLWFGDYLVRVPWAHWLALHLLRP